MLDDNFKQQVLEGTTDLKLAGGVILDVTLETKNCGCFNKSRINTDRVLEADIIFEVDKKFDLCRDSIFYAVSIVALILVIKDGWVTWYESIFMLLLYVGYIACFALFQASGR